MLALAVIGTDVGRVRGRRAAAAGGRSTPVSVEAASEEAALSGTTLVAGIAGAPIARRVARVAGTGRRSRSSGAGAGRAGRRGPGDRREGGLSGTRA